MTEDDPTQTLSCTLENTEYYSKVQYHELDPEKQEIRLLRVLPRKEDVDEELVECELFQNIPLEEIRRDFTALSYCAGSPHNTRSVLVNGVSCNVFDHLHVALIECRHIWKQEFGTKEFLLWTDQLCIHQPSIDERSHQVGFMGKIYSSSRRTLVCLSTSLEADGAFLGWSERGYARLRPPVVRQDVIRQLRKRKLSPVSTQNDNNRAIQETHIVKGRYSSKSTSGGFRCGKCSLVGSSLGYPGIYTLL
jgi:hypothetical protein